MCACKERVEATACNHIVGYVATMPFILNLVFNPVCGCMACNELIQMFTSSVF